jgi:hypothetical protein
MVQLSPDAIWLGEEIAKRGYAEFEHGITSDEMHGAVEAYARFTLNHPDPHIATMDAMLEDEILNPSEAKINLDNLVRSRDTQAEWHKYRTNTHGIGKPDGYTNRSFQVSALRRARGIIIDDDPKEYYHHTPVHMAKIQSLHAENGWGNIPPEVLAVDSAFAALHSKATALMTKVLGLVEGYHPEVAKLVTPESLASSPVRGLFYHPSNGKVLAGKHFDKSLATAQLGESHTGLQVFNPSTQKLELVLRGPDTAAFFAGDGFRDQLDSKYFIRAPHNVIATDQPNPGQSIPPIAAEMCSRWAFVYFANTVNFVPPPKSAMHLDIS